MGRALVSCNHPSMTHTTLDPALLGIWIVPGQPYTYEVDSFGGYHVAGPEEPLSFTRGGSVMLWGGRHHERENGTGETPVGRWVEPDSGDIWQFKDDGRYTLIAPGGMQDTGIWGLRDQGTALWVREMRARVITDGAHLTFSTVDGGTSRYGYTVADGTWRLLDPMNWSELSRFVSAGVLAKRSAR